MHCDNTDIGLTRSSFEFEITAWLRKNVFDETVVKNFEDESIDGEDFFTMEMWMVERLIKGIKNIKKFRTLWSQETNMIFDINGNPVPQPAPTPQLPTPTPQLPTLPGTPLGNTVHKPHTGGTGTPSTQNKSNQPIPLTPDLQSSAQMDNNVNKTPVSCHSDSPSVSVGRGRTVEKNVKFGWVQSFQIPEKFSVNVELGIKGKQFNDSQRNEFVRDICTLISTNTRYPNEAERQLIAQKIVQAFPFLKDPKIVKSSSDWGSWEQKIKHRMKRLQRTNGKRSLYQESPQSNKKKQKSNAPWQVIPPLGEDETEETLKEKVVQLRKICRLPKSDQTLIKKLMSDTYPMRRKMVLDATENAAGLLKGFPPLNQPAHVKLEMCRIMGDNDLTKLMKKCMMETWLPKIIAYARVSDKQSIKKLLGEMEKAADEGHISENECHHRAAIWILMNELLRSGGGRKNSGSEKLLKLLMTEDKMDEIIKESISPVIVLSGADLFDTHLIYVVGESRVLCDLSRDDKLLDALIIFFCIHFVFNFDYVVQRNVMAFLESSMLAVENVKLPVSVTQLFNALDKVALDQVS